MKKKIVLELENDTEVNILYTALKNYENALIDELNNPSTLEKALAVRDPLIKEEISSIMRTAISMRKLIKED